MDNNSPKPAIAKSKGFVLGAVAGCSIAIVVGLVLAAVLGAIPFSKDAHVTNSIPVTPLPAQSQAHLGYATSIESGEKQIVESLHLAPLPPNDSRMIDTALAKGDVDTAQAIATVVYNKSRMIYGKFTPFNQLISDLVVKRDDPVALDHLNAWVAKYPKSEFPYLARSQWYSNTGWAYRGADFVSKISNANINKFHEYNQNSFNDIQQAINLNPNNPIAYNYMLSVLAGYGNSDAMNRAFTAAVAVFPDYYVLYELRLRSLEPKWGGSIDAMYEFTNAYAGKAADTSPIKLLYIQLYSDLLDAASIKCVNYEGKEEKKKCVGSVMTKLITPDLETHVHDVLNLYGKNDPYYFSVQLGEILADMIDAPGGDVYRGAILQLAADAMGSNNEVRRDANNHNNFVLDSMVGNVWFNQQDYDTAELKYAAAMADIEWTKFPDEKSKIDAISGLYKGFSNVYSKTAQLSKSIAYAKAAAEISGMSNILSCSGYFELKQYSEAVRECTSRYDQTNDMEALYYRGKSYQALGDLDSSLADDKTMADYPSHYKAYGAIEGGARLGDKGDVAGMVKFLNDHAFIFDENTQSKDSLAHAYNNRCYGEMHLGDLQKALADCSVSLRYESLPDAYQKQQQLVRMLQGARPPATH